MMRSWSLIHVLCTEPSVGTSTDPTTPPPSLSLSLIHFKVEELARRKTEVLATRVLESGARARPNIWGYA